MRTLCYSVRVAFIVRISEKAYKVTSFDGSTDFIPVSCFFGVDNDVKKSDAYWIAAWILPKKKIQWTSKKKAWINEYGEILPFIKVERHTPERIEVVKSNNIEELKI